jgi:hypothetical protein
MNIQSVLVRAKEIALGQGRLANSPADRDGAGRLTFCAGACLAKAMIETETDHALLLEFEISLLCEDKFVCIPKIFERYGVDPERARKVIKENDALREPMRLSWFRSLASF